NESVGGNLPRSILQQVLSKVIPVYQVVAGEPKLVFNLFLPREFVDGHRTGNGQCHHDDKKIGERSVADPPEPPVKAGDVNDQEVCYADEKCRPVHLTRHLIDYRKQHRAGDEVDGYCIARRRRDEQTHTDVGHHESAYPRQDQRDLCCDPKRVEVQRLGNVEYNTRVVVNRLDEDAGKKQTKEEQHTSAQREHGPECHSGDQETNGPKAVVVAEEIITHRKQCDHVQQQVPQGTVEIR